MASLAGTSIACLAGAWLEGLVAHVALKIRGGTEPEHVRIKEALISRFADEWGVVVVELTLDGPEWHIDEALIKQPGAAPWSCRQLIQRALDRAVEAGRDVHIW